mmetsp:Transcript_24875/g.41677  ORF Transcript_24875/g.41677 Transcript_24875/m.41677 type:complete len:506 (+) Transcript_24875:48-1565(+)
MAGEEDDPNGQDSNVSMNSDVPADQQLLDGSQPPSQPLGTLAVIKELLVLALGFLGYRLSWVAIKTTDTALLGHVGTEALSASAIADLWMASTGVFTFGGVLGTFVGNAVGSGNKKMAGVWLQVSLVVLGAITIPTMALWFLTEPVLQAFGQSLAHKAGIYAQILALCLPARTLFGQVSQFFSAQKIIRPSAYVSAFGAVLNLVLGLLLVLGIPVPGWNGFGYIACPSVTVASEYSQLVMFFLYACLWKRLHEECWGGCAPSHITRARVWEYIKMYTPAALSGASDWWRVSVIGVFAARLGSTEVAVFNASYRITWMTLTVIGSLAGALRVKLAIQLGAKDITAGKRTVRICTAIVLIFLAALCAIVGLCVGHIARIFSNDPVIIDSYVGIRVPLCLMIFVMNLSVFFESIPAAMGRTRAPFYAGLAGSWVGQVPGVAAVLYFWREDLYGLYMGVSFGYLLLCFILIGIIFKIDWEEIVSEAQARGAGHKTEADATDEEHEGEGA